MTRVRTDNVFGTITDNPLTSGATTMNSAGLANLAAVSSTEAIIILDPNRVAGAPEIVVVTAHTGSATSATIQRGQFGTTARQHASGTAWVHGPIASNASTYVTAADDQGDFVPTNGWESWTPTLTNLTLGNGTVTAKFRRVGTTIEFRFRFSLGSTSAVGTDPRFSLPVTAHADYVADMYSYGDGILNDATSAEYRAHGWVFSTTACHIVYFDTNNVAQFIAATAPFTWATSDSMSVVGSYEAAT